jgi:hypothetical protein
MAWTQPQLDALKDAIAQGALTVKYADKEVTYRSLDEMMRIKAVMEKEINASSTGSSRNIKVGFSKGLYNTNEEKFC